MASRSNPLSPPRPLPNRGRRPLSHLIDTRSQYSHRRPFASIPRSGNVSDGYRDISYPLFANAIDRLARWMLQELGRPRTEDEALVYQATADLGHQVLTMVAVKAGDIVRISSGPGTRRVFFPHADSQADIPGVSEEQC